MKELYNKKNIIAPRKKRKLKLKNVFFLRGKGKAQKGKQQGKKQSR